MRHLCSYGAQALDPDLKYYIEKPLNAFLNSLGFMEMALVRGSAVIC